MARLFVGIMKDGQKHCGIEFDEGTMTKEKFKIISHAVDVYIKSLDKLKLIDDLEEAEDERELYEMNQKARLKQITKEADGQ